MLNLMLNALWFNSRNLDDLLTKVILLSITSTFEQHNRAQYHLFMNVFAVSDLSQLILRKNCNISQIKILSSKSLSRTFRHGMFGYTCNTGMFSDLHVVNGPGLFCASLYTDGRRLRSIVDSC